MSINKKAFVTYGWNRIAYIIKRSLLKKGIEVHMGDLSSVNMSTMSILPSKNIVYPSFYKNPALFKNFLLSYCLKEKINYLFPVHEETFILSKHKDEFTKAGIKMLLPDFDKIRLTHNKFQCNTFAKQAGLSVPDFIFPSSNDEMISFFNKHNEFVVLKYLETNSAKGVYYISKKQDFDKFANDTGKFILQQYVKGTGYGVSVLYKNGKLKASFTHKRLQEKISSGGTSTIRESTSCEVLEKQAKMLMDKLQWNGVAMVEFKYNEKSGESQFIEVNPRFWGSFALSYFSGLDFPDLMIKLMNDIDVEPVLNYKQGVRVKWVLGSVIAALSSIKSRQMPDFYRLFGKTDGYDDLWFDDPCCFVGESLYYLLKLLKTGSMNPTQEALIHLDKL
jgi:predicted ATP-grasp superfamily ATP-dependent carboligase